MDSLGQRMKQYEQQETGRRLLPLLSICARLDGKGFQRFTEGLQRPFDPRLSALFCQTTQFLVAETQALIGYTQSDEISLLWYSADVDSQIFFDRRIQKMTSILASMTTAFFIHHLATMIPEKADSMPLFDCRVWQVPTREEAANIFVWRERDATKNSLSMAARHYYPHEQLVGKSSTELHELLWQHGINWNEYPTSFKRGTYLQKQRISQPFATAELAELPPNHAAHQNPNLLVERTIIRQIAMPPFAQVSNRVAVLFEGATPQIQDGMYAPL